MIHSTGPWRIWPIPAKARPLIVAVMLSTACTTAGAQPAPPKATILAATILHVSATGSVRVAPDQLTAELVAQDTSPSAAAAQRRVNSMIDAGMKAARSVPGIDARAVGYSVWPTGDKHQAWTAQQTLELRGADGPSLLDLAGRLQDSGLAASSIDWQLSPALRDRAHGEATTAALTALQARAASAAATLGLQVDHASDIRLDSPIYEPRPTPMMAMAVRAAPSPQATGAPEEVSAAVSGDYILRP
jgi:predicted secreted protein